MNSKITETTSGLHIVWEKHYLPNKPVICETKTTVKLHIVFDAGANSNINFSLDDYLHAQVPLTAKYFGVLLRLRIHNMEFVCDIDKAFLQLGLHPSHRDFVRFLWFEGPASSDFEIFENNAL